MENSHALAFSVSERSTAFMLELHSDSVLDVGYSSSGAWMYTIGKDSNVNLWKAPIGTSILQVGTVRTTCHLSAATQSHIACASQALCGA
jgi:WD40 repeat protein